MLLGSVFAQSPLLQSNLQVKPNPNSSVESAQMWVMESFGYKAQSSEVPDLRDQNAKHFQNQDGSYTAFIAAGNLHYWENNRWNTIFHSIEPVSNGFRNIANSHKTYYPSNASNALTTVLSSGHQMKDMMAMRMFFEVNGQETNPQAISGSSGNVDFNKLTYPNVYGPGIDLRLTQETTKRKMDYIIANINALGSIPYQATYLVFEEKIELPTSWFAVLEGNEIFIMDDSGAVKAVYEKPMFKDAPQLDADGHSHSHEAEGTYVLSQTGNFLTIQTKVQLNWLTDPERAFPVVIDPTVNLSPDNANWWTGHIHTNGNSPTVYTTNTISNGTSDNMRLGKGTNGSENDNAYHAWAKFNTSSIPSNCINSVILNVTPVDQDNVIGSGCFINVSVRPLTTDPVLATNAVRLTDIRDGTPYSTISFTTANEAGLQSFNLGAAGVSDFVSLIPSQWFGVGLNTTGIQSGHFDYLWIRPHSHTNKPYITVDYIPNYRVQFSNPNPVVLCAGQTQNMSVTVTNTGCLPWTSGWTLPNTVNFSWWGNWQSPGGQDQNPRLTPFVNLAPGASQVVTFSVTAPATAGNYSIQTDLVRDGVCWFRNNGAPSCGPGNVDYVIPIIVRQVTPPTSISGATTICNGSPVTLASVGGEVVHYPFTSNLNDISGSGLNLSGSGGTISAAGLSLTNASSYTSAVSQILNIDKYTIAFEMRYDAPFDGNWRKIFGFEPVGTDRSPGIWKYPNSMQLHWRHDPGNTGISEAFTYTQGQYYQVVGVKNGGTFYLYVDGNLVAQGPVANPKTPGGAALFFGGAPVTLRNFRIYNGALAWYSGSCGGTFVSYGPTANVSPTTTTTYFLRTEGDCGNTTCVSATITVNQVPNAPTSVSATHPLHPSYCHGNTINLTSVGGTPAGGSVVDVWYENSCNTVVEETWDFTPAGRPGWWMGSTTVNSSNGILNVTSTGVDPMIYMGGLSINPNVYRYVQVRYRYVSGPTNPGMQVFFENGLGLAEARSQRGTMVMDGNWHFLNLDMSVNYWNANSGWIGGPTVTGLRFDFCESSGMVMEFDFFLVSQDRMVSDQTTLNISPASPYYPSTSTQYFTRKVGNCGASSCASTNVNLPPMGTALALNNEAATCYVSAGETIRYYHSSGRYIASVTASGTTLGSTIATAYVEPNYLIVPACEIPSLTLAVMNRHWVITPTTNGSATVRLPYYTSELTDLGNGSVISTSEYDLVVSPDNSNVVLSKYSGGDFPASVNVNNSPFDNCAVGGTLQYNYVALGANNPVPNITAMYSDFTIPGFSEFWLHGNSSNSPLPIELSSLVATCDESDEKVAIQWTTASEQNTSHYNVERSVDGSNWNLLTSTNAAGNSTITQNYEVNDYDVRAYETIYYRLQQVDQDGASKQYGPVSVSCSDGQNSWEVFPNPAGNEVTILLKGDFAAESTQIHITDINGKSMHVIQHEQGQLITVDLRAYAPGVYIVRLVNGENNDKFIRLIKQ